MTITLTREEAQQVLNALDEYYITTDEGKHLVETLRARLAQPEPEYKSYQCQQCGEVIGWLGRAMPFHKCAPPQREWQGLTDDEMSEAMDYWSDPVRSAYGGAVSANEEYVDMIATWRYIEAKLKEKNGG